MSRKYKCDSVRTLLLGEANLSKIFPRIGGRASNGIELDGSVVQDTAVAIAAILQKFKVRLTVEDQKELEGELAEICQRCSRRYKDEAAGLTKGGARDRLNRLLKTCRDLKEQLPPMWQPKTDDDAARQQLGALLERSSPAIGNLDDLISKISYLESAINTADKELKKQTHGRPPTPMAFELFIDEISKWYGRYRKPAAGRGKDGAGREGPFVEVCWLAWQLCEQHCEKLNESTFSERVGKSLKKKWIG